MEKMFENNLVISLISLLAGSIITLFISAIGRKSVVLKYSSTWFRIGISTEDDVFGSVKVLWKDRQLRNLFFNNFEIENTSSRDLDNVSFLFYTEENTSILSERTAIVNTPYIIEHSQAYSNKLIVAPNTEATREQIYAYFHDREYEIPVFNRNQKLSFTFLCTKNNSDESPDIFLATNSKGIKLKLVGPQLLFMKPFLGVSIQSALARALIIYIISVPVIGYFVESAYLNSFLSLFIGSAGSALGALMFRFERFAKRLLTS